MKKKTMLIFGVSSLVGSNLAEFFKKDYRVIGTYNSTPVYIPGVLTVPCDVLIKANIQVLLFSIRPDITIYAIGLSSINDSAAAGHLCDALNTNGLINVTEYCSRYKSKLVFISSQFVFGGENQKYIEVDIPDANTHYGKAVASAEFYIQKTSLNYVIFRTCQLYGRSINPRQVGWFEYLERKSRLGQVISCDHFLHTGFLDIMYLGMIIDICLDKNVMNRLYQVSSCDMMTHFDFARLYADVFSVPKELIVKGRWPYPYVITHMASSSDKNIYYHLDTSNIEGYLNIKLPSIEESIKFTARRLRGSDDVHHDKKKKGAGITFI